MIELGLASHKGLTLPRIDNYNLKTKMEDVFSNRLVEL